MRLNPCFLVLAGIASATLYREGDKVYAQVSDVDLGHGTTIYEGVSYAFHAPPDVKHWYISNSNGTETPHRIYLPNVKTSAALPAAAVANGVSIDASLIGSDDGLTNTTGVTLDKRQRPPAYMNYFNNLNCNDFDITNRPITVNRCVFNNAFVAWSSSFVPPGSTCRTITNYYNSGCGPKASCGGYIDQTVNFVGCFNPPTLFCSTFTTCCIFGC